MSAHLGLVTLLVRDMPRAKDPAGKEYHLHPQVQEMQKQEGLG